ncbi:ATP-dependent DNA ligase [soil metagenome]
MKFSEFAKFLERLEKTSSRLAITDILAELFKASDISEIDKVVYLSLGSLAPNYKGIVFNLADQMMMRAIAESFKIDLEKVKKTYKEKGDLGEVSFVLSNNKDKNLSVNEIYEKLLTAAKEGGEGSQERRVTIISEILKLVDPLSAKFITRIPVGKLRLGFSEKTIIDALALMKNGDKSGSKEIENAYNISPDIGLIAKLVKEKGTKNIDKIVKPVVGIPVVPMLAQRLKSPAEMIKKMGTVSVEPKYDGLRIFIHFKSPNTIRIFTRNMNFIDESIFPELKNLGKYIKANEVILDSEAVGINLEEEKILDFQATMQRRRKHEVKENASKTPLQFQVFDILLKNGKSLINIPYLERRKELQKTIPTKNPLLNIDEYTITDNPKDIEDLYKKYIKDGLEGILVKKTTGEYVSGRTGWNWVKMKEEESARGKLSDTVDCVVMGYSVGKGKRVGFGIGQFLVGVLDESGEQSRTIKTVTKVGTGLTDAEFHELKARLLKLTVQEKPKEYLVNKILEPDFWVTPSLVVELAADDITKSPNHTAGFALRFPRLVKFRDDKAVKDATTLKEVEKLYKLQK